MNVTDDPRPDLADGARWSQLFETAARLDGTGPRSALGWLRGVRCLGATLYVKADGRRGIRVPESAGDTAELVAELGERRGIVHRAILELGGGASVHPENWTCAACGKVSIGKTCWNCGKARAA